MRLPHPLRLLALFAVVLAPEIALAQEEQAPERNPAGQGSQGMNGMTVRGEVTGIAIGEDGSAAVLIRTGDRNAEPPRAAVVVARPQEVESLLVGQTVNLDVQNDRGTLRLAAPPEVS